MDSTEIRKPAVSGQFYPGSAQRLKENIERLIDKDVKAAQAIGCMLPHAGYMYSGGVAGKTVSSVVVKDNVILIGPNHTGYGALFSIMTEGVWQTPLDNSEINSDLAKAILSESKFLSEDNLAHIGEHSLEVELPFLQYFNPKVKIVPIVASEDEISTYREIGSSLAQAIKRCKLERNTLIVASSDMTHYEDQKQAEKKDKVAIEAILQLDEGSLVNKIKGLHISMCGYIPTAIMLVAAKQLGAKEARLIAYQTSADVTGDYGAVVGYAGIIVS